MQRKYLSIYQLILITIVVRLEFLIYLLYIFVLTSLTSTSALNPSSEELTKHLRVY